MFLINMQRQERQIYEAVKVRILMFVTWLDFAVRFHPSHAASPSILEGGTVTEVGPNHQTNKWAKWGASTRML